MKAALKKAIEDNVKEMIPATASLTISYLRQRILRNAGFQEPPPGSKLLTPTPIPGIPMFKPPQDAVTVVRNATDMIATLLANNCTSSNATCTIPWVSAEDARRYILELCAASVPGFTCEDMDEDQMTPDDLDLPDGVDPVPSDWPDPSCGLWGTSLPPSGLPPWTSDWPDPDGSKPDGWSDYDWERYKWNWQVYRSQYQPYRSSYTGYTINRRRRLASNR